MAAYGALSPDGRYVGAVNRFGPSGQTTGVEYTVGLISVATGEERELLRVADPEQFLGGPVVEWTPDGAAVLVRKVLDSQGTKHELWVIPVNGDEARKVDLGVSNFSGQQVRVSPDGRRIAFTAGTRPTSEVRVLENVFSSTGERRKH